MTTVWHDEDIGSLILATGGVPCTIDGVDGFALMDQPGALFSGDPARGQVVVEEPVLTIQTSAFPNAKVDSFVVIDSKWWTVRVREKEGDGGTTKLFLGPASGTPPPPPPDIIDGGGFDGTGGVGQSPDGGAFSTGPTFVTLGGDDFTPSAFPLDPTLWTPVPGFGSLKAVSGQCQSTQLSGVVTGELFTGVTIGADQWASLTLAAWTNSPNSLLEFAVRTDSTTALGVFLSVFDGGSGIEFDVVSLTGSPSSPVTGVNFTMPYTPQAGDTMLIAVQGTQVYAYLNGVLVFSGSDPNLPTLSEFLPGLFIASDASPDVAVTNFQVGEVA